MPTTVAISIGSRTSDSVTVNTVTTTTVAGYANAWSVVLSATVPSTTKIGDKLTTGANDYLIVNISGSTLTVAGDPFTVTTTPSTGAGSTLRSFPSIHTWGAAAPASLVTKDWIWKGEMYKEGGGTNGEWTFSIDNPVSQTCDATRYFWLTTAAGTSFRDNGGKLTNALRYNNANGVAVSISGSYARIFNTSGSAAALITGIQFYRPSTNGYFVIGGGGRVTVDSCIVSAIGGAFAAMLQGGCNAYNSLFYSAGIFAGVTPGGWDGNLINNTIYCTGSSITAINFGNYAATGNIIRNNTFFGFTAIANRFDKIDTTNSTYNITDLASFGWSATGNLVSKTASNQFTSLTGGSEDFRIKAGADVINAGTRDQTYTNDLDIVGTTRSLTTPTIGAWEYPTVTYTYSRPSSDITTQWTPSSGTQHYALINETTYNDANYIYATATAKTDEVGLQAMSTPQAGTSVLINYRVQGITGGGSVTVSLYCGATLVKTDTTRTADNTTPAYYTMTVTSAEWGASVTNWADMRLRFVSA